MAIVLDADVLSDLVKHRADANARLQDALAKDEIIYISPVAYYHVLRGLLHIRATSQIQLLQHLSEELEWNDLTRPVWEEAAKLWAQCRSAGHPLADEKKLDGDALIAAHAKALDSKVATRNAKHFRILGVGFEDWN